MNILERIKKAIKEECPPPSPETQAVVLNYRDKHGIIHELAQLESENRVASIASISVWEQTIFGIHLLESMFVPEGKPLAFKNSGKAHEFAVYCKMHGYNDAMKYFEGEYND